MHPGLVGRDEERAELQQLVIATRDGLSGAVVLRGEAGVGKTALLDAAVRDAPDLQHLHLLGVEAESGFAFAGLHRLIGPRLGVAEVLPAPQRDALDVAFGRSAGPAADVFLVGLATLSLLADVGSCGPTFVTVDDAHWLDRESLLVLGFVARRLDAEGVAMAFATRHEDVDLSPFDGLPAIEVTDLPPDDAHDLLRRVVDGPLDQRVATQVVRATAGNPLALCDLGASLSARQLDGSELLPDHLPVGRRLETHYLELVSGLPAAARSWLLLAAAESSGDLGAVNAAAEVLGLDADAWGPAEQAGVVTVRSRVEFRHPVVRSSIYAGAAGADRRAVHRALAAVIDGSMDPDRRASHLAAAATGPDEQVAVELERAAARAELRGGFAARAQLLSRSAELTVDPGVAAVRCLDAADAAFQSGAGRHALALLDSIESRTLSPGNRARAVLLEAWAVGLSGDEGASARISACCLRAAELARDADPDLRLDALCHACMGALFADRYLTGTTLAEIGAAARDAPPSDAVAGKLLAAFASIVNDGFAPAVAPIREAIDSMLDPATPDGDVLRWWTLGITLCTITVDHRSALALGERALGLARTTGALGQLDSLLYTVSMTLTLLGDLERADHLLTEGVQLHTVLARSTREFDIYRHAELAAWRGGEHGAIDETIRLTVDAGIAMGHGAVVAVANVARVVLDLSAGRYDEATRAATDLLAHEGFGMHTRVLPDLVEAASRAGRDETARDALAKLRDRASALDTPYALGLLSRSEALLAADAEAEAHFLDAIGRFRATASAPDLARTRLLFGEWLRRKRRPSDARRQLGSAHDWFSEVGATGFAERARIELAATGATARARTVDAARTLTAQERQIAILAAGGLTNAEIASRLFISAPTVDYHLRKVFRKLDIGSRRQLRGMEL